MAELATIARPYAQALFEACAADLSSSATWVEALGRVAEDASLQKFAADPHATDAQVLALVVDVVGVTLPPVAQSFLRTVIENGRLGALPEMARQFRALKNAQNSASDAVVYSPFPMDATALSALQGTLEKRFGRKLWVRVELQPELIGGVCVVVGDEVLDLSVKARLEKMKVALTA
jgi:F-type H+-transporting ATPase subunit delta